VPRRSSPGVRLATSADHHRFVDTLVAAFAADPFFRALWPGDALYRDAAREWFELDVAQLAARGSLWSTDDDAGIAVGIPPGVDVAGPGEYDELQALVDRTAGPVGARAMATLEAADALAAERAGLGRPHWTCVYVAVRPERQGRGLGRALLGPMLDAADRQGDPTTLASTNPRNLTFYERLGFRTLAIVQPEPELPRVWSLWREPEP
jgi:GNAT superfamily N-acetyltransferase